MLNNSDLVSWHSFDGGSYNDSSSNRLNAIQVVDVLSVPGIINEAFSFYSNSSLYKVFEEYDSFLTYQLTNIVNTFLVLSFYSKYER